MPGYLVPEFAKHPSYKGDPVTQFPNFNNLLNQELQDHIRSEHLSMTGKPMAEAPHTAYKGPQYEPHEF